MRPHFGNRGIGANDHLVTRSADRVSILARVNQIGPRGLGVVVEGLGEGLVQGGLAIAFEEGSGAENMETILQAGG